ARASALLLRVEAPRRGGYVRTILTELSRIATFILCLGEMGVQVGARTPVFHGVRDREHVLNLIEAATGGRFHPNFNRIGGLKVDLPQGWIDETRRVMKKIFASVDDFENLVVGNEIFEVRTRGVGVIPAGVGAAYGVYGYNLRASGVRLGRRSDVTGFHIYHTL